MIVHPVFEIDVKLVLEGVPPVVLVGQLLHALLEVRRKEALGNVETLELLDRVELLLSFVSCVLQCLVLLLYPLYFSFDFLRPLSFFSLAPLMITEFVFPDLFELMLLLNLQSCLLNRLVKENVQNGLDLDVVIEQVIVFNLSDLVDASLLWHVLWSWRFRLESVGLQFHFCLIWLYFSLFRKEVGQIDLDPSWWSRPQVIWTGCIFRLLEFHQLRFDHFDFLFLSLFLDAHLFLLGRRQFLGQDVQIVCVSAEDALVVHDVERTTAFLLLGNWRIHHAILGATILMLPSDYLRLRTFKTLRHIF